MIIYANLWFERWYELLSLKSSKSISLSLLCLFLLVVEARDGDWGTGAVPGISSKRIYHQNGFKNIDIKIPSRCFKYNIIIKNGDQGTIAGSQEGALRTVQSYLMSQTVSPGGVTCFRLFFTKHDICYI